MSCFVGAVMYIMGLKCSVRSANWAVIELNPDIWSCIYGRFFIYILNAGHLFRVLKKENTPFYFPNLSLTLLTD